MNFPKIQSYWLLWGTWILILGLTSIFCWERVLYQDSAYALFKVLNLQNTIEHGRYIVPLVLWPGYLFSALSLPISWVVWGISISNALWGFLLTLYFKRKTQWSLWTWSPAIILLGTGPDFFFLGISEMIPALFLTLLFAYFLMHNCYWSLPFLLLAFFAHPGILPAVLTIFGVWGIENWKSKQLWQNLSFFLLLVSLKVKILKNSEYEQGVMNQVNFNDLTEFSQSWGLEYFVSSLKSWLIPYVYFLLLILAINKMSLKKILGIITLTGATMFIVFVYRQGDSYLMMQKSFAPMILMVFVAFVMLNPEFLLNKKISFGIFSICLLGVFDRMNEGEFYRNRMKKLDKIIQSVGPGKFLTVSATFPAEDYRVNWAIPYESFVRSASQHGAKNTTTFSLIDSTEIKSISGNKMESKIGEGQFKGANFAYPLSHTKLRGQYFQLDSFGYYKIYQDITKKAP